MSDLLFRHRDFFPRECFVPEYLHHRSFLMRFVKNMRYDNPVRLKGRRLLRPDRQDSLFRIGKIDTQIHDTVDSVPLKFLSQIPDILCPGYQNKRMRSISDLFDHFVQGLRILSAVETAKCCILIAYSNLCSHIRH